MYERDGLYYCGICNSSHTTPVMARGCENSHNSIPVMFTVNELMSLLNFMMTKDEDLLDPNVYFKLRSAFENNRFARKSE